MTELVQTPAHAGVVGQAVEESLQAAALGHTLQQVTAVADLAAGLCKQVEASGFSELADVMRATAQARLVAMVTASPTPDTPAVAARPPLPAAKQKSSAKRPAALGGR